MYAKKILTFITATAICATLFTACKKETKSTPSDSDTQSAQDNALAEGSFNDIATISDQAGYGGSVNMRLANGASADKEEGSLGSGCATVSFDTAGAGVHVITIDFGATNCLCNDGRYRRGKILVAFNGHYRDSGAVLSITLNNYFVNDNQVLGTKKITNQGTNGSGNLVYKVEVNGSIIKANNGGTITWVSTRQREWTAGYSTPLNFADDAYSITGSASGTTAAGKSYTILITKPLVRKMTCHWFESGALDVTPEGKPTRTLDYGNTGCDANATVTILGYTFPIVLY